MDELRQRPWVLVGVGRMGKLLALLAEDHGVEVRAAWSRSRRPDIPATHRFAGPLDPLEEHLDGAVVWLTVVDDAISAVAAEIASWRVKPAMVLHCSGSQSSRILSDAGLDAPVGSIHPLLSIADAESARSRVGECAWTIEGDEAARRFGALFARALGVEPIAIEPDQKLLYHAAAVAASGLVTGTIDVALAIAEGAGIARPDARRMLLPLVRSTLANVEASSTEEALTGPVARGDAETVRRHMEALKDLDEELAEVYRILTLRMAEGALVTTVEPDD